jgi:hypothetical protein
LIDDQLTECDYQAQCRDVIDDACKIGTGIMEGPIASGKTRRGWSKQKNGTYKLTFSDDKRPSFQRVDPWAFFPDPDAVKIHDSEDNYIRFLWKAKELREFARKDGVDKTAVRNLLIMGSRGPAPSYLGRLRTLTGETVDLPKDLFHVWKFSGVITGQDKVDLAILFEDEGSYSEAIEGDPLEEHHCVIWFSQASILKFDTHPLDSYECTYSVFNLEKDESSIWGYGVPRMMRDPQAALNAAWRMLMDNGGLATGDQIIINRRHVQPVDGKWTLSPRKLWELTDSAAQASVDISTVFSNFSIDSHLTDLASVIELTYRQIDDGSGIPQIAQGLPDGTSPTPTPVGTEVLRANASNIIFRRTVKNWDDDMTVPNIRRSYDWNMQFSDREDIKGDFDVKPRGASVLLVRELQSNNLMVIATQFGGHPIFGKYLKNLQMLREIFRAHMLDHTEYVLDDEQARVAEEEEAAAMEAQAAAEGAAGGAAADPAVEMEKLAVKREEMGMQVAIAEMEVDARLQVSQMQHETAMMTLAEKMNMQMADLQAMLTNSREDRALKERSTAAEIAVRSSEKTPLNETQIANT